MAAGANGVLDSEAVSPQAKSSGRSAPRGSLARFQPKTIAARPSHRSDLGCWPKLCYLTPPLTPAQIECFLSFRVEFSVYLRAMMGKRIEKKKRVISNSFQYPKLLGAAAGVLSLFTLFVILLMSNLYGYFVVLGAIGFLAILLLPILSLLLLR